MELLNKIKLKRPSAYFWGYVLTILAIVTPWFFRSGYLFFTDTIWGQNIHLDWTGYWFWLNFLAKALSFILPVDFLEKIFISGVFVLILLGGRFFVRTILSDHDESSASNAYAPGLVFVLSLFALFNPFVYDRALYGQFSTLVSYACLLFIAAYLFQAWQRLDFKKIYAAAIFSGVALLFSVHFIFLLAPICLLFLIGLIGKRREIKVVGNFKKLWLSVLLAVLIVLAINANWLIALAVKASPLVSFVEQGITNQDLVAFQTAGRTPLATLGNVLLMSGFWGKDQFRYFDLTTAPGWQDAFILLTPLILYGVYLSFRRRSRAEIILSSGLLVIFALAIFLAVGIKSPLTSGLTWLLYNHLPLYKGLREPQKWVAVIIPVYLFYLTLGAARLAKAKIIADNLWLSALVLAAVIIMQAPSLLWGFNRQVQPTPYPADWYQVDSLLLQRSGQPVCSDRILFLPWHLYMGFSWAGKIMANPAPAFFSCPVLSGTDMEWGGIYDNSGNPDSRAIVAWMTARGKGGMPAVAGVPIRYIVLAKEVDFTSYLWIANLPYVKLISDTPTLFVYEVKP